jgi:outer membrane protein assembly factor BamB
MSRKLNTKSPRKLAMVLAGLGIVVMMSGCSLFSSKPANPPAPLVDFKPSLDVKKVWSTSIGKAGQYTFTPAVFAGDVLAASADGVVTRIDVASGRQIWRIDTGMKLTAGVGTNGATVAVVGNEGMLKVFDGEGKQRWEKQVSSEVLSAPAVGQGLVIIRSIDNRVAAYDEETGERRWIAQRNSPALTLRAAPGIAMAAQTAIVAMPGGRLSALTLNNGGPRWEVAIGEPRGTTELERIADVSGMPAVAGNTVCAVAFQGRVGCFDVQSGTPSWLKEFSSDVGVGLDSGHVYAVDEQARVSAFNRDNGVSSWRNDQLLNRRLSAPVSVGSRAVAVGDFQGNIHFLSQENGGFVARVATDGSPVLEMPVVIGNTAIFQTQAGTLVALTAE